MRAVVQRVAGASVSVDGLTVGAIDNGFVVLLGVAQGDTAQDAAYLAEKLAHLRVFGDEGGKMNRSLVETEGRMLVISQFTLLGDCRKGRRPSFTDAAPPQLAESLYRFFIECVRAKGVPVQEGRFGAMMQVHLTNDGPVTLLVESRFA